MPTFVPRLARQQADPSRRQNPTGRTDTAPSGSGTSTNDATDSTNATGSPSARYTAVSASAASTRSTGMSGLPSHAAEPVAGRRNMLLFIAALILVLVGVVDLLSGILVLVGIYQIIVTPLLVLALIVVLGTGAIAMVVGVLGVQNAGNRSKAGLLFKIGVGLSVLALINLILGVQTHGSIIGTIGSLLVAVAYALGAKGLKDQGV